MLTPERALITISRTKSGRVGVRCPNSVQLGLK